MLSEFKCLTRNSTVRVSKECKTHHDIIGYHNLFGLLSNKTSNENKHSERNELNKKICLNSHPIVKDCQVNLLLRLVLLYYLLILLE